MEKEKRKRVVDEEEGEGRRKKVKEVPSEEEVEEFFAILRRMKVAVKYFERSMGGNPEGWRAALEAEQVLPVEDEEEGVVVAGGDDDGDQVERIEGKRPGLEETEALDLNAAAPEESETDVRA